MFIAVVLILEVVLFTSAEKCSETPDELEKFLEAGHWVPQNVHYYIKIIPTDVEQSDMGYIESWTTMSTVLTRNSSTDRTKDVLNCTLSFPPYRTSQSDEDISYLNTSGHFIYVSSKLNTTNSLGPIFSVATGIFSTVKAKYSLEVARPKSANYTVLTGFPLTKTEQMTERTGWYLDTFNSTIAVWPKQVLVVVAEFIQKPVKKIHFSEQGKNISITVAEPFFDDETQMCIARTLANILDYLQILFKDDNKLSNYNMVRTSFADSTYGTVFYGFSLYTDVESASGEIAKNALCPTPLFSGWRSREMIMSAVQQWLEFFGPESTELFFIQRGLTDYLVDDTVYEFTGQKQLPDWLGDRGGWVFKMLEGVFSKETFRRGLIDNFLAHVKDPDTSIDISDMFSALEKSLETDNKTQLLPTDVSITDIFENWFSSEGLPRICVRLSSNNASELIIYQEVDGNTIQYENEGYWIPIEIVTEEESLFTWLEPSGENITVTLPKSLNETDFFRINPNITGWYETWYDPTFKSARLSRIAVAHSLQHKRRKHIL